MALTLKTHEGLYAIKQRNQINETPAIAQGEILNFDIRYTHDSKRKKKEKMN